MSGSALGRRSGIIRLLPARGSAIAPFRRRHCLRRSVLAQLGDKTQLALAAMAADTGDPAGALAGGILALWAVSVPGWPSGQPCCAVCRAYGCTARAPSWSWASAAGPWRAAYLGG